MRYNQVNFVVYSFLALFAVLPFIDILSPIMLGVLLFSGVFLHKQTKFRFSLKKNRYLIGVVVFFFLSAISLLYTSNTGETLEKIGKNTAFLLAPLGILLANPSITVIEKAKKTFVFACFVMSVLCIVLLLYNYIVNHEVHHHYNFVQESMYREYMPEDAMFLNTALIFVLFDKYSNYFKVIAAILFLSIIILFGVRLGLFIYLLILGVYIAFHFKTLFNLKNTVLFILGGALALFLTHQNPYTKDKLYDTLAKIGIDTSSQVSEIGSEYHNIGIRTKIWESSLELIKAKPLLGHGAGVEIEVLDEKYQAKSYSISNLNAHNQFLSTGIQFGTIGLLCLLVVFNFLFKAAIAQKNIAMFLVTLVMFLSMFTESYLEIQQGLFYFCIFATLLLLKSNRPKTIEN